jgi:hypothetical protein
MPVEVTDWGGTEMTKLDDAVRLIGGDRQIDRSNTELCVDLMKEFLRREALWAKKLGLTDEIPFANLAGAISAINYAGPNLETITRYTYSVAERRCCLAMINWYAAMTVCDVDHRGQGSVRA